MFITHIPYRGIAPATLDLVAGQLDLITGTIPALAPFVRDGRIKALAVSTPKRSPAMPNVPTVAESGLSGYGYAAWNGIVAPAGTPPEVIRRLHSEFAKAMAHPAVRAKLGGLGFDLVGAGPQEFGDLIRGDVVRLGRLVRTAGIAVN